MPPTQPQLAPLTRLLHERYGDPSTDLQASKIAALQEQSPARPAPRAPRPHVAADAPRSWVDQAACAGRPGIADDTQGPRAAALLQLCQQCPVIEQCRQWVETEPEFQGVAAGRVIRPRRKKERAA